METKVFEFNTPLEQLNEVYGTYDKERNRIIIAPAFNLAIKFTIDLTDLDNSVDFILRQYTNSTSAYSIFLVISHILNSYGYELKDE